MVAQDYAQTSGGNKYVFGVKSVLKDEIFQLPKHFHEKNERHT